MLGPLPFRRSGMTSLAVFAALLCAAVAPAAAQKPLGCAGVWKESSADNDILKCIIDGDRLNSERGLLVFPALAVLVFVLILFGIPIAACVMACCCCCCKGQKSVDEGRVDKWKGVIVGGLALCGTLCIAIFLIAGGVSFHKSFLDVIDGIESGPVKYFLETKDNIELYLTDYSANPPTEPNIDLDEFDSLASDISDEVSSIKSAFPSYVVPIVSSLLGVAFVAMIVFGMVSVIFAWGKPFCFCGWLYYLVAVLLALLAVVFAFTTYVVSGFCGEVLLQLKREPGLFQWYVLPTLSQSVDFDSIREDVNQEVRDAGVAACTELLKLCGPVATEDKPFVCGDNLVVASSCTTIDSVVRAVTGTYMNEKYTALGCPAPNGESDWKCYLSECRTECTAEELREAAGTAVDKAAFAANASTALSFVEPILESNYVVDLVVSVLEARKTSPLAAYRHGSNDRCATLRTSSTLLEVAFFVGSLMILLGLWMLRRAKAVAAATALPADVPEESSDAHSPYNGQSLGKSSDVDVAVEPLEAGEELSPHR